MNGPIILVLRRGGGWGLLSNVPNLSPAPVLCHRLSQWSSHVWAESRGAAELCKDRGHDRGVEKLP